MRKFWMIFGGLLVTLAGLVAAASPPLAAARPQAASLARTTTPPPATLAITIDNYCVNCHSTSRKSGGLVLENLDPRDVGAHPEIWEKVALKLRTEEMPP